MEGIAIDERRREQKEGILRLEKGSEEGGKSAGENGGEKEDEAPPVEEEESGACCCCWGGGEKKGERGERIRRISPVKSHTEACCG